LPPISNPFPVPDWIIRLWLLVSVTGLLVIATSYRTTWSRRWKQIATWGLLACVASILWIGYFPFIAMINDCNQKSLACNRMRQISLAMHVYSHKHDGRLPPAALYDKDGRALLSWRVLLLPYLEEEKLYQAFHLDEPWDSPHNQPLLLRMPSVYASPDAWGRDRRTRNATFYQVFVGPGTAFEGRQGLQLLQDFPDGWSYSVLFAEAGEPVPWTMPADLPYRPDGPLPPLGGVFDGTHSWGKGFHIAMVDGITKSLEPGFSEAHLRLAITRNPDKKLRPDW
jgi:hypothetical protein